MLQSNHKFVRHSLFITMYEKVKHTNKLQKIAHNKAEAKLSLESTIIYNKIKH